MRSCDEANLEMRYDPMSQLRRVQRARGTAYPSSERAKGLPDAFRSFQVICTAYQLVLLPVWVALLQSKDGRSLALVNGQTGKTVMGLTLPDEEIDSHE